MSAFRLRATAKSKPRLTDRQIAELGDELREDLRRQTPDSPVTPGSQSPDLGRRGQERQSRILAALERLRAGTYGSCLRCGEPIPYARLAAIPEAQSCIDCVWRRDDVGGG